MSVVVVATIHPHPSRVDEVADLVLETIPLVHAEEGCELYALHRAGQRLVVIEKWSSTQALEAHSSGPAVAKLRTRLQDKVGAPTEVELMTPLPHGIGSAGAL